MNNDIHFIVQARMNSTRLPGKVMLPFYEGKSILELMIDKLRTIDGAHIAIATSRSPENEVIRQFAQSQNITCFSGDENDVLQRFIQCAESCGASRIIRVCSDNPFLELDSIRKIVDTVRDTSYDYVSFDISGKPSIQTHYGFWTEYVTLNALKKVVDLTSEAFYHEHVTNYIYMHPDQFAIHWIAGPEELTAEGQIRLTIDTEEDFQNAQKIYKELVKEIPYPMIADIVSYLDRHRHYYQSMEQQIHKNEKK